MDRHSGTNHHPNEHGTMNTEQHNHPFHPNGQQSGLTFTSGDTGTPDTTTRRTPAARVIPLHRPSAKKWYNQGLVWLLVAAVGLFVFWSAVSGLTDGVRGVGSSIDSQTETLREQNRILASVNEELGDIQDSIGNGFARISEAIRDAVNGLRGGGGG